MSEALQPKVHGMFREDADGPMEEGEAEARSSVAPPRNLGPNAQGRVVNPEWGGDKIAFEFPETESTPIKAMQAIARQVIDEETERKRDIKADLEKQKELHLKMVKYLLTDPVLGPLMNKKTTPLRADSGDGVHLAKAVHKAVLLQQIKVGGMKLPKEHASLAVMIALSGATKDRLTQVRKNVLHDYDSAVGEVSGWSLVDLQGKFHAKGLELKQGDGGLQIFAKVGALGEVAICNVPQGGKRLKPKEYTKRTLVQDKTSGQATTDHREHVLVKRGYTKDEVNAELRASGKVGPYDSDKLRQLSKELRRRKEYVLDDNGVPTRRFVTRAISHYHMATMLGLKYNGETKLFEGGNPSKTFRGQLARGNPDIFAKNAGEPLANAGDLAGFVKENPSTLRSGPFKMGNAAVVDPKYWLSDKTAPLGRYILPEVQVSEVVQRSETEFDIILTNRTRPQGGAPMEHVQILGYHMRSDATKDSKMTLNERVSMQLRNGSGVAQTMLSAAAVQAPLEGRDRKIIRANKAERFDKSPESLAVLELDLAKAKAQGVKFVNVHSADSHQYKIAYDRYVDLHVSEEIKKLGIDQLWKDEVKRNALAELDEYIYSARKNREVTIENIPNSIINRVDFAPAKARFHDFTLTENGWMKWSATIEDQCKTFFTTGTLDIAKLLADQKMKEDELRKGTNTRV